VTPRASQPTFAMPARSFGTSIRWLGLNTLAIGPPASIVTPIDTVSSGRLENFSVASG
jgi:hypothetical protein